MPQPDASVAKGWDQSFFLTVASEDSTPDAAPRTRPWLGEIHRIAIYNRAWTDDEIARVWGEGKPDPCALGHEPV